VVVPGAKERRKKGESERKKGEEKSPLKKKDAFIND